MGLNTAGINAFLDSGNEAVVYVAIGSGPTATDQASTARHLLSSSVAGGVITATGVPYSFTGGSNAPATYALFFSAATAGTFYGYDALSGDQTFGADGSYALTALTITGTSTP